MNALVPNLSLIIMQKFEKPDEYEEIKSCRIYWNAIKGIICLKEGGRQSDYTCSVITKRGEKERKKWAHLSA